MLAFDFISFSYTPIQNVDFIFFRQLMFFEREGTRFLHCYYRVSNELAVLLFPTSCSFENKGIFYFCLVIYSSANGYIIKKK